MSDYRIFGLFVDFYENPATQININVGETGAKWATRGKMGPEFENSKKLQKIWTIVKFLFAIITDAF